MCWSYLSLFVFWGRSIFLVASPQLVVNLKVNKHSIYLAVLEVLLSITFSYVSLEI